VSRVDAAGRDVRADANHAAEPATETHLSDLALLAAANAGNIVDNDAAFPLINLDGVWLPIGERVWALYRAGLLHQLEGERRWRLTFKGRDAMQGRAS
jgi:hypothetical protein